MKNLYNVWMIEKVQHHQVVKLMYHQLKRKKIILYQNYLHKIINKKFKLNNNKILLVHNL